MERGREADRRPDPWPARLPDDVRAGATKDLALKIRKLPATDNKLRLAVGLAGLSTEGDFGQHVQEVATTLADTLRERPLPWAEKKDAEGGNKTFPAREPADAYMELATMVRYEHVTGPGEFRINDDGQYRAALARLEADDRKREHLDFS